jgi:hypothetical protein
MPFAWPPLDVETACALGIGGTILGLLGLLFGPVLRGRYAAAATGVLAAGWVVGLPAALAFHVEPVWWLPPLALLTVVRGLAALRTPGLARLARASLRPFRHPRVQAGLLLLACPVGMALYADRLDQQGAIKEDDLIKALNDMVPLEEHASHSALTDAGNSVPLFSLARQETDAPPPPPDDMTYLQNHRLHLSVIRNKPTTDQSNCHGWVFTGGRYWVRGFSVEPILEDNGYRPVSAPQIGDLAVYRDPGGGVAHSGIVCGFTSEREILVESKWGRLGCYIHRTDQSGYPDTTCTYYHSPRAGGHLLRDFVGLAPGETAKPVE